jgi:hypothetical protein
MELYSCHVPYLRFQLIRGSITRAVESTSLDRQSLSLLRPPSSWLLSNRRSKPGVLCSARCARNLGSFIFSAWGRHIKLGSSPNRSSLRDYKSIRRYLLPLAEEYLYIPKHFSLCIFGSKYFNRTNVFEVMGSGRRDCWFCRTAVFCLSSLFRITQNVAILTLCGYLDIACSSNFSKFDLHVINCTLKNSNIFFVNGKFRLRYQFKITVRYLSSSSGRAVYGVVLRPSACWDCGFESHRGHGRLSCTVFVLTGRGLCDGPIPRPEESYRLWCVSVIKWK